MKQFELKDVSREELLTFIKREGEYRSDNYLGTPWRVLRRSIGSTSNLFHLCGYVGLTTNNKYFNCDYDQIPVDVHGGLTYSSNTLHWQPEKDLWWIGFDCAHSGDVSYWTPDREVFLPSWYYESYKTMDYVEKEIKKLIRQIIKLNGK